MGHSPRTQKGLHRRLSHKRCFRTNSTPAESRLWAKLRSKQIVGIKFRRQNGIDPYIVDFFCPERNLVIEVDGDVHPTRRAQEKDVEQEHYLQSLGLRVIRYTNDDVLNNFEGVLLDLLVQLS